MKMQRFLSAALFLSAFAFLSSCSKEQSTFLPAATDLEADDRASESTTYPLNSVSDPDISGTVTFQKVGNDRTKVTIILEGTEAGNTHPAHIHFNDIATGGGIAVSLSPVKGASGRSITFVTQEDDGTPLTYEDLLVYDGYVNVHLSATQLSTIVAQGNIGSNY